MSTEPMTTATAPTNRASFRVRAPFWVLRSPFVKALRCNTVSRSADVEEERTAEEHQRESDCYQRDGH
jgi:hypothetical protein